jgi:hypothetical protein
MIWMSLVTGLFFPVLLSNQSLLLLLLLLLFNDYGNDYLFHHVSTPHMFWTPLLSEQQDI